jgi:hypothetical protein
VVLKELSGFRISRIIVSHVNTIDYRPFKCMTDPALSTDAGLATQFTTFGAAVIIG